MHVQISRQLGKIYVFCIYFYCLIPIFSLSTSSNVQVRTWAEQELCLLYPIFLFHISCISYNFKLGELAIYRISHIFLSAVPICSYPRIVLIQGPTLHQPNSRAQSHLDQLVGRQHRLKSITQCLHDQLMCMKNPRPQMVLINFFKPDVLMNLHCFSLLIFNRTKVGSRKIQRLKWVSKEKDSASGKN